MEGRRDNTRRIRCQAVQILLHCKYGLHIRSPAESRTYTPVPHVLSALGVQSVRLMTNNPFKLESLRRIGCVIDERVSARVVAPPAATRYIETKCHRMGHFV